MAKKIEPSDVATQLKWDIGAITDFCASVLEEANDHNISLALRALNADDFALAKEFIDLEAEHAEAGELTPELNQKRKELMEKLDVAEGAVDESEEDPRDRGTQRNPRYGHCAVHNDEDECRADPSSCRFGGCDGTSDDGTCKTEPTYFADTKSFFCKEHRKKFLEDYRWDDRRGEWVERR